MSKQCGYCRMVGHDVRGCEIKKNQILTIQRHIGRERKTLHDLTVSNGYGVGAMVQARTYRGVEPCVITSLVDTFKGNLYYNTEVEWRMHRYRKSVCATLSWWSGEKLDYGLNVPDDYVRFKIVNHMAIVVRPLNDLSDHLFATVDLNNFSGRTKMDDRFSGYWGSNFCTLLAPSNDTDVTSEHLTETFQIHERLTKDRNYYARLPPILP